MSLQKAIPSTYPNRVVLAGCGQDVLVIWVPVQAMDFGEVGSQVLNGSARFLQEAVLVKGSLYSHTKKATASQSMRMIVFKGS